MSSWTALPASESKRPVAGAVANLTLSGLMPFSVNASSRMLVFLSTVRDSAAVFSSA
jgi:hypothetical protein